METRSISISRPHGTRKRRTLPRRVNHRVEGLGEPEIINTDQAPTYGIAVAELKAEGKCSKKTAHRQVRYLNNVIEADHGKLKQLILQVREFKTLKTAYATTMDLMVMCALSKGQANIFNLT